MELDQQTRNIVHIIEAQGYRVEIDRVKGRTKMAAVTTDGDEKWGIAATPYEAAVQLLDEVRQRICELEPEE